MSFDIRRAIRATLDEGGNGNALAWNEHWYSWNQIRDLNVALDGILASAGLTGAPLALVARNRPGSVGAMVAQVASGRATRMIHAAQSPAGIAADIAQAGVGAVIAEQADWGEETIAAAKAGGILGIALQDLAVHPRIVVERSAKPAALITRDPAVCIELLSSGTTGRPKHIPLTWSTLSSAAEDARAAYAGTGVRAAPQILLHPLGNIAGAAYLLPAYAFAQPVVLLERFTVAGWVDAVRDHRPSRASLPAAALRMLLDSDIPAEALQSLDVVAVGGGKLDVTVQERFETRFGIPVLTAFGATEFAGVIANWNLPLYRSHGAAKRGSAGRASPNVDLRIVDRDSHVPLPAGEIGLLEAKVARLGGAWIRTTDLAVIDADGFLFVHGRADGAINRGGFKIVPETVVSALLAHPAVADAAVVARADDRLGEVPVAAVELCAGHRITGAELREWLKERLIAYQVPVEIRVFDRLPRTGSMKVALGEVAALFAELPPLQRTARSAPIG